jgi:brefeldin A-inhibited guanine nucleotide-exchange protein
MEISGYGGHVGSDANDVDLSNEHYMQRHAHATEKRGVSGSQPAIYSLQKLVEVTHFNMESRPRLIFADIWETISTHLTSTALHEEAAVAMYAVDSLRQLSMQFLSRDELGAFEFQRRFLAPLETISTRSTHTEVKELLLSSVEQIVLKYGFDDNADAGFNEQKGDHLGTLRSGWRSVLIVLGTSGLDKNDSIATQGFKLLQDQIQHCVASCGKGSASYSSQSLLSEHFVDLVNALLLYVSGPRQDLSSKAIDNLLQLSNVLADGKVPLKSTNRRKTPLAAVGGGIVPENGSANELELWWPMLLGLSQTMGDRRSDVRVKGLTTLLAIINKHFFTPSASSDGKDEVSSPKNGDMQTLQLIFRGVLIPALEFEEMDGNSTSGFAPELLPTKFVHYITLPPEPDVASASIKDQWINTTFEHLVDGCISICIRSLETFGSDALIEEVLAMLNSCLLSDSGHLAVKGLRRLQHFVTSELNLKDISDDTWATVSHMLVRVLSVRGLPPSSTPNVDGISEEQKENLLQEHREAMNEFIREQHFFSNRRYIGCNGAMVIGALLNNGSIVKSMGVRWQIFLISGLGQGIRDWERAAEIMDSKDGPSDGAQQP